MCDIGVQDFSIGRIFGFFAGFIVTHKLAHFVRNGLITPQEDVLSKWQKTLFLREEKEISAKGWLLDVMRCVEKIGRKDFTLEDVYKFERELSILHPENNHVKDKIRQQLQVLRDKNYLEFVSRGKYHLI